MNRLSISDHQLSRASTDRGQILVDPIARSAETTEPNPSGQPLWDKPSAHRGGLIFASEHVGMPAPWDSYATPGPGAGNLRENRDTRVSKAKLLLARVSR